MFINEHDLVSTNLKKHFEKCYSFIRDAISKGGKILVHSYAGVSRSSTIVI